MMTDAEAAAKILAAIPAPDEETPDEFEARVARLVTKMLARAVPLPKPTMGIIHPSVYEDLYGAPER